MSLQEIPTSKGADVAGSWLAYVTLEEHLILRDLTTGQDVWNHELDKRLRFFAVAPDGDLLWVDDPSTAGTTGTGVHWRSDGVIREFSIPMMDAAALRLGAASPAGMFFSLNSPMMNS